MNKMIFSDLVNNYSVPFQLILPGETSGEYVDGEWVPNNLEAVIRYGAIVPYENRQIFQSGGKITTSDRQLVFVGSIPIGSIVIDGENRYEIEREDPYAEHYSDTNIYHLKAVSVFG